jgi:hypothetical protein
MLQINPMQILRAPGKPNLKLLNNFTRPFYLGFSFL